MTDLVADARRFVQSPDYCELTLRQLALLGIVVDSDGPRHVRDLAQEMRVAKPVVTRAVQKLKTLGLLTHARSSPDRRDCLVSATEPGRTLRAAFALEPDCSDDLARQAFAKIQEDAPPDVPRWHELYEAERRQLIRFAHALLRLAVA